jgi:hypothetical protein
VIQLVSLPASPSDAKIIEAYAFGPDSATFTPAATVTVKYDAATLTADVQESNLYIALLENASWTEVPSKVDTEDKTVTARLSHFSTYALLGKVTAAPVAPAAPTAPAAIPSTTPAAAGSETPSGMSIPFLAIIIAGGLLVIILVIVLIIRQRSSYQ